MPSKCSSGGVFSKFHQAPWGGSDHKNTIRSVVVADIIIHACLYCNIVIQSIAYDTPYSTYLYTYIHIPTQPLLGV